jgi:hypothetical protein
MKIFNGMNFIKKNWQKFTLALYAFFAPAISFAQNANCTTGICNPIPNVTSIPGFIQVILTAAIQIGLPIVALAVIYSGFLFVAARGNPEKLGKAKDALLYSLIGAALLLGAWALANVIKATVTNLSSS